MQQKRQKPWKDFYPGFLYLMGNNGWMWQNDPSEEDFNRYSCNIFVEFEHVIDAVVYEYPKHLDFAGVYGIGWLEWRDYNDRDKSDCGYTFDDLEGMICALEAAEESLVKCGIPFSPNYRFHGPNKANMKRQNDATRRKLNMERWEKEAMEKRKTEKNM